jgi:hypothetical protein
LDLKKELTSVYFENLNPTALWKWIACVRLFQELESLIFGKQAFWHFEDSDCLC